jgi:hypothetical protein
MAGGNGAVNAAVNGADLVSVACLADLVDDSIVREIEKEGFIERVYRWEES